MRKIFILAIITASLVMGACVEQHNLVVLDKFIPVTPDEKCIVKTGGERYYTKGYMDLAFTDRYMLHFQITNYISSSQVSDVGSSSAPIAGAEANRFFAKWVEVKYEWDPRPQADDRRLELTGSLWNKARRIEVHGVVADPEGSQVAAAVDIFTEAQARDLLAHVNDIDWVASPLLIKLKVVGEITDGSEISTNTLNFNIIPNFGESIQMGSTFREPEGGFADEQEQYDTIMAMCAFESSVLNGCYIGQDATMVNCYADDSPWQKFIATSYCHLDKNVTDCYHTNYGAASVIEVITNRFKKSSTDNGYYYCCPSEEPEAPEEEEAAE